MSQAFDSTDYIERAANLTDQAFTVAGWIKPNSLPATDHGVFHLYKSGGSTSICGIRWDGSTHTALRLATPSAGSNISTDPTAGDWIYVFLRYNGTTAEAGWKTIAESAFSGSKKTSVSHTANETGEVLRVGGNPFYANSLDMHVFRLSVWDESVSDANLLLAAATDLGYTTNINTHLPLTNGIGSPWNDTSGNGRNWTASGTFSDVADPSFSSGNNDLGGSATAGATGSATLAVQRNLAAAAVAGALASGTLSINRALTGAAIGAALGSATLTVFSSVWRIPTNAPNGTAVHCTVFSGASPTYAILAQGTAVVAGGFIDIPGSGTIGAKAFAFVHNYSDNTATANIRGGPAIATLTSL